MLSPKLYFIFLHYFFGNIKYYERVVNNKYILLYVIYFSLSSLVIVKTNFKSNTELSRLRIEQEPCSTTTYLNSHDTEASSELIYIIYVIFVNSCKSKKKYHPFILYLHYYCLEPRMSPGKGHN